MEIVKIKDGIYYIPNATNIGVIADEDKAIIIDTGIDKDTIKKASKVIFDNGLTPIAVINTHSHADHCGGNKWLQETYRVVIYAPELEASIISDTELEPLYLFSGAKPISELDNKFLKAQSTDNITHIKEGKLTIHKKEIEIIPLHGHTPKQIGVLVDDVLFCADSYFPKETIEKHKIIYHTDIEQSKKTLEWLKTSDFEFYLPSHGKLDSDIKDLVDLNLRNIYVVSDLIGNIVSDESTTEEILKRACNLSSIEIKTAQQYYLMNTVILSYLSYLKAKNEISFSIKDNQLFWKKIG